MRSADRISNTSVRQILEFETNRKRYIPVRIGGKLWLSDRELIARDKDAVAASMALCEAAAYYKTQEHDTVGCHD